MRKHIGFVELIIVLSVIAISVRMWLHHKEQEIKNTHDISRSANIICSQCARKTIIIAYNEKLDEAGTWLQGKMCPKCHWLSFKCPQCGGDVFRSRPSFVVTPGAWTHITVGCKRCKWYSEIPDLFQEGYYVDPRKYR